MADIHFLTVKELQQFKSLISGKTITQAEKISIVGTLREKTPDLFANLTAGLPKEKLTDNLFLIKYLSDSYNKNKIKLALRQESSLSISQQAELEQALEQTPTTETATEQVSSTTQSEQSSLPQQTSSSTPGNMFGGMPSPGMSSPASGRVFVKEPPPTSGKAGGTGEGRAATNKLKRFPQAPASLKNTAANFSSRSQIFAKRWGGRIFNGLTQVALPGGANLLGRTGLGAINHGGNFISNLSNTRLRMVNNMKGAGSSLSSSLQGGKKFALASALVFFLLMGIAISGATNGTTPTGEAAPIGGSGAATDISSCKFTRAGDIVEELTYKSPLLLSYIQQASSLTGIPPVVLAAFIRVETPSTVTKSDEEIKNLSSVTACPRSPTGALGVMQLQPKGTKGNDATAITNGAKLIGKKYEELTEEDYCDVRKNIIMGAGFILEKMSYKTPNYPIYGDGTTWDLNWTNDKQAIEKLVSGYYGCVRYGSSDDVNNSCSDPGRKYSYADDVSTSIQNCQATSVATVLPAPVNGDYKGWIKGNFNIDVSGLSDQYSRWAYEILNTSTSIAPKFKGLIFAKPTKIVAASSGSYTSGDTINIRTGYDSSFFKQIFIHELGHRIKGSAGTTSPQCGGETLEQIQDREKYLTYYAENATPASVKSPTCGTNDQTTKSDEDFAESVSYYINSTMPELNYGSACSTYNQILRLPESTNPYNRDAEPRASHKTYIKCLLGP